MRKSIKGTTISDRLLLLFLVTASIAGIFLAREAMPESGEVVIEVDGQTAFTAALRQDRVIRLQSSVGPVEVEISNGRARVREAHCQNQLCVKQGWVSRGIIVCLPGRIVVFVGGRDTHKKKDIDAVTG
ncbi:MAG: NusG domain II-containing protein [Thermodesulfovibrionales bacterium]